MSTLQFNLLPDVKLAYITAQRTRNLIMAIAFAVTGAAVFILLITLITVQVVQKKQLSSASSNITSASKQLKSTAGINQVLTVQNQLTTLAQLQTQKHISSRVFTFLPEIIPTNVHVGQVGFDYKLNTMNISGTATNQLAVNTFADTLKFAKYKLNSQDSEHAAFTSVVESGFSINANDVTYSLTMSFDPALFSFNQLTTPQIVLHNQVTTRSAIDDPSNVLFNGEGASAASTKTSTTTSTGSTTTGGQ